VWLVLGLSGKIAWHGHEGCFNDPLLMIKKVFEISGALRYGFIGPYLSTATTAGKEVPVSFKRVSFVFHF
jgi:hypothetical protein